MQSLRQYRQIHQSVLQQLDAVPNLPASSPNRTTQDDHSPTGDEEKSRLSSELEDRAATTARQLDGIEVREREAAEGGNGLVFVVKWNSSKDALNPYNWTRSRQILATCLTSCLSAAVTTTSSVEAAVQPQAAEAFHVSETAASLTTGIYLIGFAVGSLIAGSFSETFGRNYVYILTLVIYMLFILGAALSRSFASILICRFLSGFFGSTPLTVAGGTVADLYRPLDTTWGFPLFAIPGFAGPLLGPVIAAWIPYGLSFHWAEWLMLILSGLVFTLVVLLQPETYTPLLLQWKAASLRKLTGDGRYRAESEIHNTPLLTKLAKNMVRPFTFVYTELIVLVFALYLTILYIVLFTFFSGFTYIFEQTYGLSQGMTNTIFVAVAIGNFSAALLIPIVYRLTKTEHAAATAKNEPMRPEVRLWFAMLGGAISIPMSLFWIAWTCYSDISIWSSIVALVFFGFGLVSIFITAYMYIIDVYQIYAASALSFNAFLRYLVAGGMTVAGIPMYEAMGPHWTCTFLGILSLIMMPVPYVLYKWGHLVRQKSKNVVNRV